MLKMLYENFSELIKKTKNKRDLYLKLILFITFNVLYQRTS